MNTRNVITAAAFALFALSPMAASAEIYCDQAGKSSYWENLDTITLWDCLREGETAGRDINGVGEYGHTILEMAIMHSDNPGIVESILGHGADPNFMNEVRGNLRPLAATAQNPNAQVGKEMIELLVDAGADLNAPFFKTVPTYATLLGFFGNEPIDVDFLDFLVDQGADFSLSPYNPEDNGVRPSWVSGAVMSGADLPVLQKLYDLGGGDLTFYIPEEGTDLYYAAMGGRASPEVIDWLVENGVDPTIKDGNGKYAWELVDGNVELAAKLQEVAGIQPQGGIPGLATAAQIQNMCRANLTADMLKADGVTGNEACA